MPAKQFYKLKLTSWGRLRVHGPWWMFDLATILLAADVQYNHGFDSFIFQTFDQFLVLGGIAR